MNTLDEVEKSCDLLKHFFLAFSWGRHESLAIPAAVGIVPNLFDVSNPHHRLVQLYIELEDPDYLIDDLKQALEK